MKQLFTFLLFGIFFTPNAITQNFNEIIKAVASDRAANDHFGISVSISGDYAIVGAYLEDEDASGGNMLSGAGSAYIFKKDEGGWGEVKKIVASDREATDQFGRSVFLSGDYAIVGAYREDEDASGGNTVFDAGSAYIFKKDEGGTDNWGEVKKIVASDREATDEFGRSVSLSGGYAIVGAYREDEDASGGNMLSGAGSAYIFKKDEGGMDNWGEVKKIVASDRGAGDQFGLIVSISGDYTIVGALYEDEDASGGNTLSGAGSAYIFKKDEGGTDNWGEVKKIVASDREATDQFGSGVFLSGDYAIVGAYREDEDASGGNTMTDAGSAYIFKKDEGGTDNWGQVKKIVASDRGEEDRFGNSVSISGDYAIVGALGESEDDLGGNTMYLAGSTYIFKKDEGGAENWGEVEKIVAPDRGEADRFGFSVSISGDYAIVGAIGEDEDASGMNTFNSAGSAYVFKLCTGEEVEVTGNGVEIAAGDTTPSTTDDTNYGAAAYNGTSVSKTFTINNIGTTTLEINSVNISGNSNFTIASAPAATVVAGGNTTLTIQFTPSSLGLNAATVQIFNSDCNEPLYVFDIQSIVFEISPSDKRGKMINFNGISDYVNINNIADNMVGEESFTFEAWIKADATQTGDDRIICVNTSGGGNRILFYLDDGILKTHESNTDTYTNASLYSNLRDDEWHHVALTHDGSTNTHSVYLDGELVASKSGSVGNFTANDLWSIGQEYDSGPSPGDYFKGKFDEIRIWKDVRTIEEIRENMHLTFSAEEIIAMPDLVAYYQFDNDDAPGTPDGVKDILGNQGTSVGSTYSDSEVAVGGGKSSRQSINAAGTFPFADTDIELIFTTAGGESLPDGEIVVTKIETEKPINVSANEMTNFPEEYWVIDNYGTNQTGLGATVKFLFEDGQIHDDMVTNHSVHKRGSRQFETANWDDSSIDDVNSAASDNYITAVVTEFSQFSVSANTSDFIAGGGGGASMSTITLALNSAVSTAENIGNFVFRFTRSGGDDTIALPINFGISGTADNADFSVTTGGTGLVTYTSTTKMGTITFPANATTVDLTISPTNDNKIEANETIVVQIEAP